MKLKHSGKNTSKAQVVNVSAHGVWLLINGTEYFLPFKDFPWFKKATIAQLNNVRLLTENHLFWPSLDVDLEVSSLANLQQYPLIYK